MEKEQVIIDIWNTEDGYQIYRVYLAYKPNGVFEPPSNTSDGGFFSYGIDEEYFEDWEVVKDYRKE